MRIPFFLCLLFSCSSPAKKEANHFRIDLPLKKKAIIAPPETAVIVDEKFLLNDTTTAFTFLKILETNNYPALIMPGFEITKLHVNFDTDPELEYILHLHFKDSFGSLVYVLDKQKNGYVNAGQVVYIFDAVYEEVAPVIDLKHKIIFYESRINGTSDDGFIMVGAKLIDGKLTDVVSYVVEHDGGEQFDDERDQPGMNFEHSYSVRGKSDFENDSTILTKAHVIYKEYIMDDKWKQLSSKNLINKICVLRYKYNSKKKSFDCFNKNNELLENPPSRSFEFVDLIQKKKI